MRLGIWIAAELLSLVGDQIYFLVLSWLTVQSVGATGTGAVLASAAIPRALLMVLGGSVVDRVGARRVAIYACLLRAGALAITGALFFWAEPGIFGLALIAAVFGAVDALFYPASGALPPTLVPAERVLRLQNIRNVATRVALVIGAPCGAGLLAFAGPGPALGAAGAGFVVCALAIGALRPLEGLVGRVDSPDGVLTSTSDGLRHVAGNKLLWGGLVTVATFEFSVSGAVNVGFPVLARQQHWGAGGLGVLIAAIGAGAGLTALFLAVRGRTGSVVWAAGLGGALCALSTATLASDPVLAVAVVAAALVGVSGALVAGAVVPALQTTSAPQFVGRVMALFALCTLGLAPLSLGLAGAVAGLAGVSALLWLTAILSTFAAAVAVATGRGPAAS